ncbi:LysR family transcriptional regulator [Oceanospirillum sediminis]|uniref:LysR family transcriptional regulator n=1 Tax=Oceanospirillum sediminis TaxID=2760088 RepID=A0A839IXS0_9GAMM|nr:LysR family transcriptional regulator [Oceanospirillum sediminis]MBB1488886.1 LysR family transcriptional regulator [Oceanospirillum sediminis]
MKDLSISLLRTFVIAARTLNLGQTAQILHKAPSTISMQLNRLEECLDTTLLERGQYGVRLTASGKQLEQDARQLISLHDQIMGQYQHAAIDGTVRLGTHDQYATRVLTPILESFVLSYPEANLEVFSDHRPQVLRDMLYEGKLDIALIEMPAQSEGGERLARDELVWVCSQIRPMTQQTPLPLAVFVEGCYHRQCAQNTLKDAGRDYRIAFSSQSRAGIIAAVKAGIGIGILPRSTVESGMMIIESGLPELPGTHTTLFLDDNVNEATTRLANTIRDSARQGILHPV